ncbi:nucleoside-diphosphate-sugar epimerase [Dyadobacter sp. BE34]|uniref:Nucleoside-diphosphate-sugar epimerase n=1 Tax=Dyadobacter fermentans TaxID=94254 RepID=A0ABU1R328_9BACT|nr:MULTISPECIES: NAD(P)-binding domain-containing protein [Dyadobacter]MDR6807795.1 nucleoside-diphosphate-sugar epimerase [Dyadobacter fermentans]MDR7045536.1 nucleoside-diphosphate-sugar epimerase [Dyadobacter sp. BE242]MDR7199849.1 nucleoside-diphosphate-sugar epimerase [Dyadobacter sp. BE34]MDR7217692.1 nucleoside-diphosphate-sugar epimerase [Dyadobacter sp. BE31]MDR7265740.1 nucleoside-diphosphate-sugar epimerase [Dyadobacter sp. BE32]
MSEQVSKVEKKRISILGCGWLGFPLAKRLLGSGITSQVKGSTTSEHKLDQFAAAGIDGYLLPLNPEAGLDASISEPFFDSDVMVISIPPRMSQNVAGNYSAQMRMVAEAIRQSPAKEVVFVSSTGVYRDLSQTAVESDVQLPEHSAQPEMVAAENAIAALRPKKTVTILRLSGLLGYNRIPGKYVQGQKEMTTGDIPVNYIHRDDAVGIILAVIRQGIRNETFNITAPFHPTRSEVYVDSCAQFGWEAPTFKMPEEHPPFKLISGDKFSKTYQYEFKYSDPLLFHYQLDEGL